MNIGRPGVRSCILVGAFLLVDWYLIRRAWLLEIDQLTVLVAIPLSQCSLAALWAGSTRTHPYLRFVVPPVVILAVCFTLNGMLPWGASDPVQSAWVVALIIQTLLIMSTAMAYQSLSGSRSIATHTDSQPRVRFSFDIRTLMLWTAVIALAGGYLHSEYLRGTWTAAMETGALQVMPTLGLLNGAIALLCSWPLTARDWNARIPRLLIAIALIGVLCTASEFITNTNIILQGILIISAVAFASGNKENT